MMLAAASARRRFAATAVAANHYAALGVGPAATREQVREAYLKLAKQHHPDRNAGRAVAADRFKSLQAAWETLGDPAARTAYDGTLGTASTASAAPRHPSWSSYSDGTARQSRQGHEERGNAQWYEDLRWTRDSAEARRRMHEEMRGQRSSATGRGPGAADAERIRAHMQQFEDVMKVVRSDPTIRRFVTDGMQAKLVAQLVLILGTLLNLALLVWMKPPPSSSRGQGQDCGPDAAVLLRKLGLA